MNKRIIPILLGIFLISLVSASYNLSAGDTQTFDIGQVYDYYSIIGNTSPIEVSQAGTIVTITIDKYAPSNSFNLIFFNQEKEVIIQYSGGGGGSSHTNTIIKNQTEYVEVLKYINQTEYINNSCEECSIDLEETEDISLEIIVSLILLGIVLICFILQVKSKIVSYNQKRRNMPKGNERRLKNDKTRNEESQEGNQ